MAAMTAESSKIILDLSYGLVQTLDSMTKEQYHQANLGRSIQSIQVDCRRCGGGARPIYGALACLHNVLDWLM